MQYVYGIIGKRAKSQIVYSQKRFIKSAFNIYEISELFFNMSQEKARKD